MVLKGESGMYEFEVDGRRVVTELASVTAADVAALAGLVPPDAYAFVRIDLGRACRVSPDEAIALDGVTPRFRSGRATTAWRLQVDGEPWDWLAPSVLASDIRAITGVPDHQQVRVVDSPEAIAESGLIDLSRGEALVTFGAQPPAVLPVAPAMRPRGVPVVINGRPRELANPNATFEDLVKLAFPELAIGAGNAFTVTYRRGAADRPDGSLVPRQAARLAPGAVINVSATNRS